MTPLQWKKKHRQTYQQIADAIGFDAITGRNKVWRHFTGKCECDLKTAIAYNDLMGPEVGLLAIEKAMKRTGRHDGD